MNPLTDAMRAAGIRFFHFHDLHGRLVATVAARRIDQNTMRFAGAVVSDRDYGDPVVTKELGATIAYGRVLKGDSALLPVDEFYRQVADATVLLWLGSKHAITKITKGHDVYSRGVVRRKTKIPAPVEIPQEVHHEP